MKNTKKVIGRYLPTEENPRTGQSFYVVGAQFKTFDEAEEFTDMIKTTIYQRVEGKLFENFQKIWNIGSARNQYELKRGVKKDIEDYLFSGPFKNKNFRDLVAIQIQYIKDAPGTYQII